MSVIIKPIVTDEFASWLAQQSDFIKNWLKNTGFTAKPESYSLIPDSNGNLSQVLLGIKNKDDFWTLGMLPLILPTGNYHIENMNDKVAIAWGLGSYQFSRYKKQIKTADKNKIVVNCS